MQKYDWHDKYIPQPQNFKRLPWFDVFCVDDRIMRTMRIVIGTDFDLHWSIKQKFESNIGHEPRGLEPILDMGSFSDFKDFIIVPKSSYSLKDLLQRNENEEMGFEQIIEICIQIVEGLCQLHDLGIVHCDLKPANILYFEGEGFKIGNFDRSVLLDAIPNDDRSQIYQPSLYQAPEVVNLSYSKNINIHSLDTYSIGLVFLNLITKNITIEQKSFASTILLEKSFKSVEKRINSLDIDKRFKDILEKILCKDADHRPNAKTLLELLKNTRNQEKICNSREIENKFSVYKGDSSTTCDRPLKKETHHQNAHICLIGDSSGSINRDNFLQIIGTFRSIISKLHSRNPNNQFSVIEFATTCKVHSKVSSDLNDILEKLPKEKSNLGGGTNLALALQEALDIFKNEMTDERRKFLYVFTDGYPDDRNQTIIKANDLKIAGVDICCIGIGSGIDMNYVQQLSPHKGHLVQDWEQLNSSFEQFLSYEYDDSVRIKFTLKNRPFGFGENVRLAIDVKNYSEKTIPKGATIKFFSNSYFDVNIFKIRKEVKVDEIETFEFSLDTKANVTVRDLYKDLEYSITTPSSSVIETGRIEFWTSDFSKTLVDYRPPCGIPKLNIACVGIIGSGKSSFNNSLITLVDGFTSSENRYVSHCITAPSPDFVTTTTVKNDFSKIFSEDALIRSLNFTIVDSFGVTEQTYKDPTLLQSWFSGMLGESFSMDNSTQYKTISGHKENQIHCPLFFLSQGDRGEQVLMEKLKKMYQEALSYGLQPLVVITKMDEVRGQETPQQVIEQVSKLVGANTDLIFAIENYHGGNMKNNERNFEIDKETLSILLKAFEKGDAFIRANHQHGTQKTVKN